MTSTDAPPLFPDRVSVLPERQSAEQSKSPVRGIQTRENSVSVTFGGLRRIAFMVTPEHGGPFRCQAAEAIATIRSILREQEVPMVVTKQTVFLANPGDEAEARQILSECYGQEMPLTLFVEQPPCGGEALAIEAWAVDASAARVAFHESRFVTVEHDGLRLIHSSAGLSRPLRGSAYRQAAAAFHSMAKVLRAADATFDDVVRTWLYQGGITREEEGIERYRELNRARSDFFQSNGGNGHPLAELVPGQVAYPASTGIGTKGLGLTSTCLAVQSTRNDARLLPLENPGQTSAFAYPKKYSRRSPKFSRAMALRVDEELITWVSGTASIVNAGTVHPGDAAKQTEQTLDNIENLVSARNFALHGWSDVGAELHDLAGIRVYVKWPGDYETCRAVCERRLGGIPAIYARADICRPDLLVEIEGVAFSSPSGSFRRGDGDGRLSTRKAKLPITGAAS